MKEIGHQPSDTAQTGGKEKETGQRVRHYVIPDGPFARAFAKLRATGFTLRWQSQTGDPSRKAKKASKTKNTFPDYGQNARAKPDAVVICGACYEDGEGEICAMFAETEEENQAA
jgi:hypothetical protein